MFVCILILNWFDNKRRYFDGFFLGMSCLLFINIFVA